MQDFIYDQQDIFSYYDEIFESRKFGQNIPVRKSELPFANLLENNYDSLISEFLNQEDKNILLKIRWYDFNEFEKVFENRK